MSWELTLLGITLLLIVAVGIIIKQWRTRNNETHGILNVDCSDPADGPYLYLELTVPIQEVADQKRVVFNVNVIPKIS